MKGLYDSNNSGGHWWVSDQQWKDLEAAGWKVNWNPERWLGALACTATLECNSIREARESFESVTGLDTSEEGCPCCGEPHYFGEEYK